MGTLTLAQIDAALEIDNRGKAPKAARWFDGNEWHSTNPPTGYTIGIFEGKAGKSRRFITTRSVVAYKP
jgi:hypothetical protein